MLTDCKRGLWTETSCRRLSGRRCMAGAHQCTIPGDSGAGAAAHITPEPEDGVGDGAGDFLWVQVW